MNKRKLGKRIIIPRINKTINTIKNIFILEDFFCLSILLKKVCIYLSVSFVGSVNLIKDSTLLYIMNYLYIKDNTFLQNIK